MKANVKHIEILLNELSSHFKHSLNRPGLQTMNSMIKDLGDDYLYKKLFIGISKAKKEKTKWIGLRDEILDNIAQSLNYLSYQHFISCQENPIDSQLKSCEGNYYSYVRRNAEQGVLYRSPVQMIEQDRKLLFQLHGPKRIYKGEVKLKIGCLFILMETEIGKQFHHIYKIGKQNSPTVLMGIFSAVSTVSEPIGGRSVLIRNEAEFKNLKPKELSLSDLNKSKLLEERRLAEYFSSYNDNNLRLAKVDTFTIDDLGTCD